MLKSTIRWLLALVAVVLVITGLGITQYSIVESLSFGLLTKGLAHRIHTADVLWISFLVLFVLHISLSLAGRVRARRESA